MIITSSQLKSATVYQAWKLLYIQANHFNAPSPITKKRSFSGLKSPPGYELVKCTDLTAVPCCSFPEPGSPPGASGNTWPGSGGLPASALGPSARPPPTGSTRVPARTQSSYTDR